MGGNLVKVGLGGSDGKPELARRCQAAANRSAEVSASNQRRLQYDTFNGENTNQDRNEALQGSIHHIDALINIILDIGLSVLRPLHLLTCCLIALHEAVRSSEKAQHIQAGEQILHFAHSLGLLCGTDFTQGFYFLLKQLW